MHNKKITTAGKKPSEANKFLIMLHGRGGSAEDILSLASYLNVKDFALLAPQATNNTWYPYSFLSPPQENEPWLSSALQIINDIVEDLIQQGIKTDQIYFLGFSQGACLTLEFVLRNANKFGGVVAFTGGLIGDQIYQQNYKGDFGSTPVFIGSSDPDPHVPVQRVHDSVEVLEKMNASVTVKIYKNMGHTVSKEEIDEANSVVFGV